jgi:hypothetical protein
VKIGFNRHSLPASAVSCRRLPSGNSDGLLYPYQSGYGDTAIWIDPFVQISVAGDHACAIDLVGSVWCFGNGFTAPSGFPSQSSAFIGSATYNNSNTSDAYVGVYIGMNHQCILTISGTPVCYLYPLATSASVLPIPPVDVKFSSLAVTDYGLICGLVKYTLSITCWGNTTGLTSTPPTGNGWHQLVCGPRHCCATSMNGIVQCWSGQYSIASNVAAIPFASSSYSFTSVRVAHQVTSWWNTSTINQPSYSQTSQIRYSACGIRSSGILFPHFFPSHWATSKVNLHK